MKRVFFSMCVAVAASAAAVMAQSGSMDKGQMDSQKMTKDGMVMVTGCLAEKSAGGGYMLNNATMSSAPATTTSPSGTSTAGTAGTITGKETMDKGMSGEHMMMSYELSGGGDLKAHVGHKIEVSGSVDKATMEKMHKTKMDKTSDKPAVDSMDKDKKAMGHDTPMKLKVTSVKMISASCS